MMGDMGERQLQKLTWVYAKTLDSSKPDFGFMLKLLEHSGCRKLKVTAKLKLY